MIYTIKQILLKNIESIWCLLQEATFQIRIAVIIEMTHL